MILCIQDIEALPLSFRKSHEATPLLPAPTPVLFPLDFAQLLQATSVNPASRARLSRVAAPSPARSGRAYAGTSRGQTVSGHGTLVSEKIDEEAEEDWDLVDEDFGLD